MANQPSFAIQQLVFAVYMSGLMSLIMSGVITGINTGLAAGFFQRWMPAWAVAWAVACPLVILVAPFARRVTDWTVRGLARLRGKGES